MMAVYFDLTENHEIVFRKKKNSCGKVVKLPIFFFLLKISIFFTVNNTSIYHQHIAKGHSNVRLRYAVIRRGKPNTPWTVLIMTTTHKMNFVDEKKRFSKRNEQARLTEQISYLILFRGKERKES